MKEASGRETRLGEDHASIARLDRDFEYFSATSLEGTPPHSYRLDISLPGYVSEAGEVAKNHRVLLRFPLGYPRREAPKFDFESKPVFHPNVAASGWVCMGFGGQQTWHFGFQIEDLLARLIEIIIFVTDDPTAFNPKSQARSGVNWTAWANQHRTPLYEGPIFPSGTRRARPTSRPQTPLVTVRKILRTSETTGSDRPTPVGPTPPRFNEAPTSLRRLLRTRQA